MNEILYVVLAVLLQGAIFYCLGWLLLRVLRVKTQVSLSFLTGYLFYFTIFELLYVPCVLLLVPLNVFSILWIIVLALILVIFLLILKKRKREEQTDQNAEVMDSPRKGRIVRRFFLDHSFYIVFLIGAVVLQCVIVIFSNAVDGDSAYYVGMVSTSIYTNTLERYNPYTGLILKEFSARYVFASYPMHNAVWSRILLVHPMVQSKVVMALLNVLSVNSLIYQLGKKLFHGNRRQADVMTCFMCILQLYSYTGYTQSAFFFTRISEGKGVIANLTTVLGLYLAVWMWQDIDQKAIWYFWGMASISALAFSGSGILFPAIISAGVVPILLLKKRKRYFWKYLVCMLPQFLYAAVYFITEHGYLILRAS